MQDLEEFVSLSLPSSTFVGFLGCHCPWAACVGSILTVVVLYMHLQYMWGQGEGPKLL